MHQLPRPPPTGGGSPANADQTIPLRNNNNNPRDQDLQFRRTASPLAQGSGSSDDFTATRQDQPLADPMAQMQRLNQVIQNFHTKAALIILHSRVDLTPAYSSKTNEKRVNKWFNIELDETDDYTDDIKRWKRCDVKDDRPQPLVIETYLTTETLGHGHRLVILDDDQKRWDVKNALETSNLAEQGKMRTVESPEVILERWTIKLGEPSSTTHIDLAAVLPLVYKKSIVLFRSLYTYCNFLPAWKLSRKVGRGRSHMAMRMGFRILDGTRLDTLSRQDNLEIPLCGNSNDVTLDYSFGVTESPAGPFSVEVRYREHCDFRIDDSEELLSSRFLGADDDFFRQSEPKQDTRDGHQVGSLPNDPRRNLLARPELGHAYGSMSTFHQAGISPGTSPISALRAAKELGGPSPSPEQTKPPPSQRTVTQNTRASLRGAAPDRRSSFSFQPFKAPALSASPLGSSPLAASPRSSARIPTLGSLTEEGHYSSNTPAVTARNPSSLTSDPMLSSTSSSPKPAPVTRFSSSFTNRRGRLSADRTNSRTDEDQGSSGKGSSTSSTAQPGSGLIAETSAGGSSGSVQDDDENISDFLKMLDTKKDLLTPTTSTAADASARRTAAALNRFHKMRDSNAALSDSMSSSLMLQRSSTSSSRQLSGVPTMVAGTSVSSSSSPGKPVSPHTPHMPFAPSRLSAAYSHDETEVPPEIEVEDDTGASDGTAVPPTSAHIPAIDIPNSPRTFLPAYRRSSSAQRRPVSSEDDIADLYGMRSLSMGAQSRRADQQEANTSENSDQPNTDPRVRENQPSRSGASPPPSSIGHRAGVATDETASDSGSGRSSAHNVYRSRFARGGNLGRGVTPPQGSTSSFGGTGASLERGGDSGSASGSWGRGGHPRSGSRPQFDEDELFPFAMETSHFNNKSSEDTANRGGASER